MDLGHFSISLSVKDIHSSLDFYQKLGFKVIDGGHLNTAFPDSENMKWRIMVSGDSNIGLFEGMFKDNILTFHPKDVLSIQQSLKNQNVALLKEADGSPDAMERSVMLTDPDGNVIMLDEMK